MTLNSAQKNERNAEADICQGQVWTCQKLWIFFCKLLVFAGIQVRDCGIRRSLYG